MAMSYKLKATLSRCIKFNTSRNYQTFPLLRGKDDCGPGSRHIPRPNVPQHGSYMFSERTAAIKWLQHSLDRRFVVSCHAILSCRDRGSAMWNENEGAAGHSLFDANANQKKRLAQTKFPWHKTRETARSAYRYVLGTFSAYCLSINGSKPWPLWRSYIITL